MICPVSDLHISAECFVLRESESEKIKEKSREREKEGDRDLAPTRLSPPPPSLLPPFLSQR